MCSYICDPGSVDDIVSTLPGQLRRIMMKICHRRQDKMNQHNRRLFVSVHLRIPSIMSIKTVSDEDLAMNLCRLWQAIPDGNLSM